MWPENVRRANGWHSQPFICLAYELIKMTAQQASFATHGMQIAQISGIGINGRTCPTMR